MSSSSAFQQQPDLSRGGAALDQTAASAIQPQGLLLLVREPLLRIVQASTSAGHWLRRPLDTLLLATLRDLGGDIAQQVRAFCALPAGAQPMPLRCIVGHGTEARPLRFTGAVQRTADGALLIELEPLSDALSGSALGPQTESGAERIRLAPTVDALLQALVDGTRSLLACDRVTVHRCSGTADNDEMALAGSIDGCILAEARTAALPSLLGRPDPAAALPADAWAAPLAVDDLHATPSELVPQLLAAGVADVSRCVLRLPPRLLAQDWRDGGAAAAMVIPVADRTASRCGTGDGASSAPPWGLLSASHAGPHRWPDHQRAAAQLLADAAASRLAQLAQLGQEALQTQVQAERDGEQLAQHLVEASASGDGDWPAALQRHPGWLLRPLARSGATAAVLWLDGRVLACGDLPPEPALAGLRQWLNGQPGPSCSDTSMLAVRIGADDWLAWLRATPSLPWSAVERATASALGRALGRHCAHVQAVRLLIAESQCLPLRAAFSGSQVAMAVALDGTAPAGVHTNPAFDALAGCATGACDSLAALQALFCDAGHLHRMLGQVRAEQRPWQGELLLRQAGGGALPVAVRAEPVPAREGGLLGLLLIVDESLSSRSAAVLER